MDTIIQKISPDRFLPEELEQAGEILRNGGLVAFPTETVYGLGADALSPGAAAKIYEAKGRPSDNPLIIHIAGSDDLRKIAKVVPDVAEKLAEAFWPGPLTMIFPKRDEVPHATTGGLDTVAVRMPSHPIASAMIRVAGCPIAAPSANISGRPSPTRAGHVIEDLDGRIDMIIDGGQAGIGLESTIVDLSGDMPVILRPGAITLEMLEKIAGEVNTDPAAEAEIGAEHIVAKAPGMKYRHYAPKGQLVIVEGEMEHVIQRINTLAREREAAGSRTGVIAAEETKGRYPYGSVRSIGSRQKKGSIAAGLYDILREMDGLGVEYIYAESFREDEMGNAIMNRMLKAAAYHVIHV